MDNHYRTLARLLDAVLAEEWCTARTLADSMAEVTRSPVAAVEYAFAASIEPPGPHRLHFEQAFAERMCQARREIARPA